VIAESLAIVSMKIDGEHQDESKANDCSARREALTIVAIG